MLTKRGDNGEGAGGAHSVASLLEVAKHRRALAPDPGCARRAKGGAGQVAERAATVAIGRARTGKHYTLPEMVFGSG